MKKIDKNYIIIILVSIVAIFITLPSNSLFGSTTDWISQHIVFPDYFRNLFFETHELFPSFAFNIGAGQNIYYFSYYGLLNPIILISYFLPFIDMTTYIILANIILYILFGIFSYMWLSKHFDKNISLILSIISILASPVLFHFHRHFMFVDYLPFLILGLIGVDKYIDKNKCSLLIISVFLIIMMSYYYSITAILTIVIYYMYRYIDKSKEIKIKDIFFSLVKFAIPILIAVLLSAVLLVPTFLALLDGREAGAASIDLLKLLIPSINIDSLVYSSYTIGLTGLAVISTISLFQSKKKNSRFLSILLFIIITIPLFIYILNGTLYIRDKILIAMLPLFIVIIGDFLTEIFNKEIKLNKLLILTISTSILFIIFGYKNKIYYIEAILILICLFIYYKRQNKLIFIIYILISALVNFGITNNEEEYVTRDMYNKLYDQKKIEAINDTLKQEDNVVRFNNLKDPLYGINKVYNMDYYQTSVYSSTSNSLYKNFYTNIFNSSLGHRNELILASNSNIFYQMYMGVKYIYSTYDVIGYDNIGDNVYKNDDVLPMFYVSYNSLNEDEFNKIKYPYNIEALLNNVITNDSKNMKYKSNIEKTHLSYTYDKIAKLEMQFIDNVYFVTAKDNLSINLKLNEPIKNKILIITFKLNNQHKCSENDSEIKINNVVNKLTCKRELYQNNNYLFHYVISSNEEIDTLKVKFKKGLYMIEDIDYYIIDYDKIKDVRKNVTEAFVDKEKTKGDVIELNVDTINDGYFVTTLPYDKGYTVYVDGKIQNYERINTSFLGFKINKGKHNIKIVYKANGLMLGKFLSVIGIISFIIYTLYNKKNSVK